MLSRSIINVCVVQHTRGDPPRPLSTRHCVCGPPTYMSSMLSSWARSDMRDGIRLSLWLPIGLQIQAGYKGTLGPTGAPHWSATIRVGTRLHNEQPLADPWPRLLQSQCARGTSILVHLPTTKGRSPWCGRSCIGSRICLDISRLVRSEAVQSSGVLLFVGQVRPPRLKL